MTLFHLLFSHLCPSLYTGYTSSHGMTHEQHLLEHPFLSNDYDNFLLRNNYQQQQRSLVTSFFFLPYPHTRYIYPYTDLVDSHGRFLVLPPFFFLDRMRWLESAVEKSNIDMCASESY
jgi:hypothetical protein